MERTFDDQQIEGALRDAREALEDSIAMTATLRTVIGRLETLLPAPDRVAT